MLPAAIRLGCVLIVYVYVYREGRKDPSFSSVVFALTKFNKAYIKKEKLFINVKPQVRRAVISPSRNMTGRVTCYFLQLESGQGRKHRNKMRTCDVLFLISAVGSSVL